MEILNLIIKQKYFDEIIAGRKKEETRECKPETESTYLETGKDGFTIDNEDGSPKLKHYDAIRFYVGYRKDRDSALVEVKASRYEDALDDNGDIIEYAVINGKFFDLKLLNAMRKTNFKPGDLSESEKVVKEYADNLLIDDPDEGFAINEEYLDEHPEISFWTPGVVVYELGEVLEKHTK